MPQRRARAPLTAASERRLSLRAKSMLDTAAMRSYLDKHTITIATGLLLRLAEHTGETAAALMTRLRIPESRRYLITRCGQRIETYKGDKPPPVIKRFLNINKMEWRCDKGRLCDCTQYLQRIRCVHRWPWPSVPEGDNLNPWFGDDEDGPKADTAMQ